MADPTPIRAGQKPAPAPVSTQTALSVVGFILVPLPLALPLCIILWKIALQWTP